MSQAQQSQHRAAVLVKRGAYTVQNRPTPIPSTKEVLLRVHFAAMNPIDYITRDRGWFVDKYPAIGGSDCAGVIEAIGSGVDTSVLKVGSRVLASARSFWEKGRPDYGAFQEKVLVTTDAVTPIPDDLAFDDAATLPLAVMTVFAGFHSIGLISQKSSWSLPPSLFSSSQKPAILVWGAGSSVGALAVQICNRLGFSVYATASTKHHAYIKTLGAHRTFDYNAKDVVSQIVSAVKDDGATMTIGYLAIGSFPQTVDVLSQVKPANATGPQKLAYAGFMPMNFGNISYIIASRFINPKGVEAKFVVPPPDEKERSSFFNWVFGSWLTEKLQTKEIVPAPPAKRVDGGLDGVNKALDELKKGVSGVKLTIEV
ncbi:hypothetical protein HDV00_004877 [Rhizophlyctis rosea]|nr:hypothetical protein HDV00_004877 [Rhizophlyctis rosea]